MSSTSFDWNEYLVLSKNLLSIVANEAAHRTSASRAYYAVYWKARLILEASGVIIPQKNIHKFVWASFEQAWNQDGSSLGKLGTNIKAFRVSADYKAYPNMTKNDAAIAVNNAEDLIKNLEQISTTEQQAISTRATALLLLPEYSGV